ncbi:HNH endonuclease signature motif containing protein [Nocardioides bruguierae]|uniref:HNH endonuclease n=1 Tax=Nocardioides bruguierae TaxID=2945102 RepID=A0A9X2IDB3_9ACTN|nr:HNH endonuclease signature motif containing protein [Nocardioides bruguierae]MCM0618848.1 HNH endonuclease [Nocardioides bruguierae]
MAITPLEAPEPLGHGVLTAARVAAFADAAHDLVDDVGALDPIQADAGALHDLVESVQQLRSRLAALESRALAAVEARDLARTAFGWGSTTDWYTHLAGLRRGAGRRLVEAATILSEQRQATLEALETGAASPEQAQVVLEQVDRLPGDDALREVAELTLLDHAHRLNATDLDRTAVQLLADLDPDGAAARHEASRERLDRVAHHRRFLSITDDGCGGVRLRGRGTLEDAAVLRAALLPLTSPVSAVDPSGGERTLDPRDHGARMWDALVRLGQHALDTDLPPESHGARARLAVTVPLQVLSGDDAHACVAEDGTPLPASTLRSLACDADVLPVVLGGESEILDIGRQSRVVPVALWRALVARDAGCTFPGCARAPVMCHAHHVQPWAEGGATSLENLAMLCGQHHRLIHGSPWQVRIRVDDGRPEFLEPVAAAADGPPAWRRDRTRLRRPARGSLAPEPQVPRG